MPTTRLPSLPSYLPSYPHMPVYFPCPLTNTPITYGHSCPHCWHAHPWWCWAAGTDVGAIGMATWSTPVVCLTCVPSMAALGRWVDGWQSTGKQAGEWSECCCLKICGCQEQWAPPKTLGPCSSPNSQYADAGPDPLHVTSLYLFTVPQFWMPICCPKCKKDYQNCLFSRLNHPYTGHKKNPYEGGKVFFQIYPGNNSWSAFSKCTFGRASLICYQEWFTKTWSLLSDT